jgi:hypothetical protein
MRTRLLFFWLVIVAALTLNGCQQETWHTFSSPQGGFAVSLPYSVSPQPRETTKPISTTSGTLDVHMFIFESELPSVYMVAYADYPAAPSQPAESEKLLDHARDWLTTMGTYPLEITHEQGVTLDGYPGREISFKVPSAPATGAWGKARLYLVKQRLYIVLGNGADERFKRDVDKFLGSLSLSQ